MSKLTGKVLTLPKMMGSVGAKTINIGGNGEDGATFIPSVSDDGVISWTNDKELPNPEPVNIKGAKGDKGDKGDAGANGKDGYTPVKGVDYFDGKDGENGADGKDGAVGPQGPQGLQGEQGIQGPPGKDGAKGDKGDKGDKGSQGPKGDKGDTGATGPQGPAGSDATVTDASIKTALGYTPAKQDDVDNLSEEIIDLKLSIDTGGSPELLGQTPYRLTSDAKALLLQGEGVCSYAIKSDTVADLEGCNTPTLVNCEVVEHDRYYEFKSKGGSAWYDCYADFVINGLTIGESYVFYVDGLGRTFDSVNYKTTCGYYILCAGTSYSSSKVIGNAGSNVAGYLSNIEAVKLAFTATTESVVVRAYPSGAGYFSSGESVAEINSFYINRANTSNKHTTVINTNGMFTDNKVLNNIPAWVTITSDPACYVYTKPVDEESKIGKYVPLYGKKVVCFGDSLFGMYRGADSAPTFIAESTGATVYNVGFGGCRMSVHPTSGYAAFSMWALAKAIVENNWTTQDAQASSGSAYFPDQLALLKSIDFSTVDYVVIHYGTNDFGAGTAIPIDNKNDHADYNTLCGALRYSIEKLLGKYPKLKIFVSLPVFRFWTENGVTTYSDAYVKHGNKLTEFVEALRSTASEYNLPVIDGYYGLGINKANASTFLEDGTHHNANGRQRFGEYIGANLIAQQTTTKIDGYSRKEIDAMFGSYVDDLALLVGGDA